MRSSYEVRQDGSHAWLPALLQTADALFPTGAYAHSLGFEEAVRLGVVRNEGTLIEFLRTDILPAQEHQELPYLHFAYVAAANRNIAQLLELDADISAWKLARETREASLHIGRRRLQALLAILSTPLLVEYQQRIAAHTSAGGHHLTVCALQAVATGIPLEAALHTWLYQALAGICSASLKLIRIGQEGCQRVLRATCEDAPAVIARALLIPRHEAGWFNPMLEIASMRHEFADERLFIS